MKNSRTINLLGALSKKELTLFGDYLASSLCQASKNCLLLFQSLSTYHPVFDSADLEAKSLFYLTFGTEKKYYDSNFRTLQADFRKHLKQFLAILELQEEGETQNRLFCQSMIKRKKGFELKRIARNLEKKKEVIDPFHYFYRFTIYWKLQEVAAKKMSSSAQYLLLSSHYLDKAFVLAKLKIGLTYTTHFKKQKEANSILLLLTAQALAQRTDLSLPAYFPLQVKLIEFANGKQLSLEIYQQLIAYFEASMVQLGKEERTDALFSLAELGYANMANDRCFLPHLLNLLKVGVEEKLFIKKGEVDAAFFRYVVEVGSQAALYGWVQKVIEQYQQLLPQAIRGVEIAVNSAFLYFYTAKNNCDALIWRQHKIDLQNALSNTKNSIAKQKKLETGLLQLRKDKQVAINHLKQSISLLNSLKTNHTLYNLRIRFNLIRSYYELYIREEKEEYFDQLLQYIKRFETYLRSKDLPNIPLYKNSAAAIKSMLLGRLKPNDTAEVTRKKIEKLSAKPLWVKTWIEDMAEEYYHRKHISQ